MADDIGNGVFKIRQINALAPLMDRSAARAEIEHRRVELGRRLKGNVINGGGQRHQVGQQCPLLCGGGAGHIASVADASEIWNHRKRRVIRPLDDIADLFDDLAPVLFKVCVADGRIVGRCDTDDDHRFFTAGKFDDLLNITNTRVLQRQLTPLNRDLQISSALRLPIVKTGIPGSGQSFQLREGKHARRTA